MITTAFIFNWNISLDEELITPFVESSLVKNIFILTNTEDYTHKSSKVVSLVTDEPFSSDTIKKIISRTETSYLLLVTQRAQIIPGQFGLERMIQILDDTNAGMVYSHYTVVIRDQRVPCSVNDYQYGSVRDDFNFGPLLLLSLNHVRKVIDTFDLIEGLKWAGLYDLRLKLSAVSQLFAIKEYLYNVITGDIGTITKHTFHYLDPRNKGGQIEMEHVLTDYLKREGVYLSPSSGTFHDERSEYPVHASIIIPVYNRQKTISDAITSALSQKFV